MAISGKDDGGYAPRRTPGRISAGIASPSYNLTRKPAAQQTVVAATPARTTIAASTGGGGGGGGGGGTGGGGYSVAAAPAPAPAPPPRRSLADVIAEDFQLKQQRAENERLEQEYGAETTRLRGETDRDIADRRADLTEDLADMSIDSAEDLAGRGLLNSGGLFLNQDRINEDGARRSAGIAELLTSFLSQRAQGLQGLQAKGRGSLNERIGDITTQYGQGIGGY